ncbi:hypothetical protein EDI28_17430 [Photobacterium chitinilyticum]|uniref:Uncharacterized protein n=1 Tax=Photobacterium chitinilyticum TaxID=2485123 RepID=A0A3S3QZU9_9GAMM|nr:hypothetical protein EDI28_17430 [Photobacterium chitinilyticum]
MYIARLRAQSGEKRSALVDLDGVIDYYTPPNLLYWLQLADGQTLYCLLTRVVPGFGSGERHGLSFEVIP